MFAVQQSTAVFWNIGNFGGCLWRQDDGEMRGLFTHSFQTGPGGETLSETAVAKSLKETEIRKHTLTNGFLSRPTSFGCPKALGNLRWLLTVLVLLLQDRGIQGSNPPWLRPAAISPLRSKPWHLLGLALLQRVSVLWQAPKKSWRAGC